MNFNNMTKEEFINGWLSHVRRPNYPQKSIDQMRKDLDNMVLFESKKLKKDSKNIDKECCDVCGSIDIVEAPHMGKNCNTCNPL